MSPRARGLTLLVAALVLSIGFVAASIAQGGLDHGKTELANPCLPRPAPDSGGTSGTIERIALNGLDGAACHLRVSRERLVVGLASDDGRRRLFGRAARRTTVSRRPSAQASGAPSTTPLSEARSAGSRSSCCGPPRTTSRSPS